MTEGDMTPEEAANTLRPMIEHMRDVLSTMEDETVLDDEKLTMKRLVETLIVQVEEALFAAEFFVPEMTADMKEGWQTVLIQARSLEEMTGEENPFAGMADTMVQIIESWEQAPKLALRDEVTTADARKRLTVTRRLISQTDGLMADFDMVARMPNSDHLRNMIERQAMELQAQVDQMERIEAAIVAGLEKRGEPVPKWRRKK